MADHESETKCLHTSLTQIVMNPEDEFVLEARCDGCKKMVKVDKYYRVGLIEPRLDKDGYRVHYVVDYKNEEQKNV